MPDDPMILEMDPVQKLWMFENWVEDQRDQGELAKNHACLVGSFWNPEAVKQIMDTGNKHKSTDEEFEETSRMVRDFQMPIIPEISNGLPRRKRMKLKE